MRHHRRRQRIEQIKTAAKQTPKAISGFTLLPFAFCAFACTLVQLAFAAVQHGGDNLIHVVVLIFAQTATEDDLRLGLGQLFVLGIQCAVFGIVDGVVWLIAGLPLGGILSADDRFGQVVAVLVLAELEPFMLDDAGPRGLTVGVVDSGVALEAGLVQQVVLKADRAVFQRAQLVVKVGINGAGVDDLISQCVQRGLFSR